MARSLDGKVLNATLWMHLPWMQGEGRLETAECGEDKWPI
jgi:hypothetical protein